jgi:hypothetical protein
MNVQNHPPKTPERDPLSEMNGLKRTFHCDHQCNVFFVYCPRGKDRTGEKWTEKRQNAMYVQCTPFIAPRFMQLVVVEEHADGFAVVDTTDGLAKDGRDVQDVELGSQERLVLVLGHRVGHNQLVDGRRLDAVDGIAAEDAVGEERIDFGGTLLLEELGRPSDGVAGIRKIVDEDADTVRDVADEHHAGVLPVCDLGGAAFLRRGLVSGREGRQRDILPCG